MMKKPAKAVAVERKIRRHRRRCYVLRLLTGGRLRLAYLHMRYYKIMGTMLLD